MDEFDKLLTELGWARNELARRLGLAPESISRWQVPPRYALVYLRAMTHIKALRDEMNRLAKKAEKVRDEAERVLGE